MVKIGFPDFKSMCHEMSEFYKHRAMVFSFYDALNAKEGKELIDASGNGMDIALKTEIKERISFAGGMDGRYFARIEGRKFYPVDLKNDYYVKAAKKYEKCEKSLVRRVLFAPEILVDYHITYTLDRISCDLKDIAFQLDLFVKLCKKLENTKQG